MNPRVIALRGRGSIGKSTTLAKELTRLLIQNGWRLVSEWRHGNGIDVVNVYTNDDGVLLGVASAGDKYDEVAQAFATLVGQGCTVIICACRTKDMPNAAGDVRGTNTAMREFSDDITYIDKTIADRNDTVACDRANETDAQRLLNLL